MVSHSCFLFCCPPPSAQPPADWAVPQSSRLKYRQLFNSHDKMMSGHLTGTHTHSHAVDCHHVSVMFACKCVCLSLHLMYVCVSGPQARTILMQSSLPQTQLATIWWVHLNLTLHQNRKQQSFKSDFFLSCFSPQESFRYWPGWKTDSWGVYLSYAPHRYGYVRVTAAPCVTSRIPPTIIQVNAELNTRMLLTMCWSLKQEPKNQPPNI